MSKLVAFSYYGGKFYQLNWILKHLPYDKVYVEPFGGSGIVLLNRKQSKLEIYNDIDFNLVNFFRVIRKHQTEFIERYYLTPYSRVEFHEAKERFLKDEYEEDIILKALDWFQLINRSFNGILISPIFSRSKIRGNQIKELSKLENLPYIVSRLRDTLIENQDASELIQYFDSEHTVFYLDPPYTKQSCEVKYINKYSDNQYYELFEVLKKAKGRWLLSGYSCELLDTELSDYNRIEKEYIQFANTAESYEKRKRTEVLWANYDLKSVNNTKYKTLEAYF
jgi:DNA adenine methylase